MISAVTPQVLSVDPAALADAAALLRHGFNVARQLRQQNDAATDDARTARDDVLRAAADGTRDAAERAAADARQNARDTILAVGPGPGRPATQRGPSAIAPRVSVPSPLATPALATPALATPALATPALAAQAAPAPAKPQSAMSTFKQEHVDRLEQAMVDASFMGTLGTKDPNDRRVIRARLENASKDLLAELDQAGYPLHPRVVEAKRIFDDLVAAVDDAKLRRGAVPPWQAPDPAVATPAGWQPAAKYAPPAYLVAPVTAAGGQHALATETVEYLSDAFVQAINDQVRGLLGTVLAEEHRETLDRLLSKVELIERADQLIGDRWEFPLGRHRVSIGFMLNDWRQASDEVEIQVKDTTQWRQNARSAHGHTHFFDINLNAVEVFDQPSAGQAGGAVLKGQEAYIGLATFIGAEHAAKTTVVSGVTQERTSKGSSYRSLLFLAAARPVIEVTIAHPVTGAETVKPSDPNQPAVANAIGVLVARENAVPVDDDAILASSAVHPTPSTTIRALHPANQRVRLPRNSIVDAFTGAARLRKLVQEVAAEFAKPGSEEYWRLLGGLQVLRSRASLHKASGAGYEIIFGRRGAEAPASVVIEVELTNPAAVILRDGATWADIDDRFVTGIHEAQMAADIFDVTGYPLLSGWMLDLGAVPTQLFGLLWPERDVEASRPGRGLDTEELYGVRLAGQATSMVSFDAKATVRRTDRPTTSARVEPLPGKAYVRMTQVDAMQLLDLPADAAGDDRDAQELIAPAHLDRWLNPFTRVSELSQDADGLHDQVRDYLWQHHPWLLPSHDGQSVGRKGLPARNERILREMLSPDDLAARMHQLTQPLGYSFPLAAKDRYGLARRVLVRIRAVPMSGGTFVRQLPGAEMDFNATMAYDLTSTGVQIWSAWAGLQWVLSFPQLAVGRMTAVEARPMGQFRFGRIDALTTGVEPYGMYGVALDGAMEEDRQYRIVVTVAPEELPTTPLLNMPMPGGFPVTPVAGPAPLPPPAPLPAPVVGLGAAEAASVVATVRLMIPRDFCSYWSEQPGGGRVAVPFAHEFLGATPPRFQPTTQRPLPPFSFVAADMGSFAPMALAAFARRGVLHMPVRSQTELEEVGRGLSARLIDLLHDPLDDNNGRWIAVWQGELGHGNLMSTPMGSVEVRVRLGELTTTGVSESFGSYSNSGVTDVAVHGREYLRSLQWALRLRFPTTVGEPIAEPTEEDPDHTIPGTAFTYQPQAARRWDWLRGAELEQTGSQDRFDLDLDTQVIAGGTAVIEIAVVTWDQGPLGRSNVQRQEPDPRNADDPMRVIAPALVILSASKANQVGLLPDALVQAVTAPASPGGTAATGASATGQEEVLSLGARPKQFRPPVMNPVLLPPDFVTAGSGLGHATIGGLLHLRRLHAEVVRAVREYGPLVVRAVDEELSKATSMWGGIALLDHMLRGLPIPVQVTGRVFGGLLPRNYTVTVHLRATLTDPQFQGVSGSSHYASLTTQSDTGAEESRALARRDQVDWWRFWAIWKPTVHSEHWLPRLNDFWWNWITSYFQERTNTLATNTGRQHTTGTVVHGPLASFSYQVHVGAWVEVGSALGAFFDVPLMGLTQRYATLDVPDIGWLPQRLTLSFDPATLATQPTSAVPTPVPTPAVQAAAASARPISTADLQGRLTPNIPLPANRRLADRRTTMPPDPALLREIQVEVLGGLNELGAVVNQLLRPPPGQSWILRHLLGVEPGSSWFNSDHDITRQVSTIISQPFVSNRLVDALGDGTQARIRLPGRVAGTLGFLELVAEVVSVAPAPHASLEVMSKKFTASRTNTRGASGVIRGHMQSTWVSPAWTPEGHAKHGNVAGGLFGADLILTNDERTTVGGPRVYRRTGNKRTGRPYRPVAVQLRWHLAFRPDPSWIGAVLAHWNRVLPPGWADILTGIRRAAMYEPPAELPTILWVPEEVVTRLSAPPVPAGGPQVVVHPPQVVVHPPTAPTVVTVPAGSSTTVVPGAAGPSVVIGAVGGAEVGGSVYAPGVVPGGSAGVWSLAELRDAGLDLFEVVRVGGGGPLVWLRSAADKWDPLHRAAARALSMRVPVGLVGVFAHGVGGRAFAGGKWLDPVAVHGLVTVWGLGGRYVVAVCEGLAGGTGSFADGLSRVSGQSVWASRVPLVVDVVSAGVRGGPNVGGSGRLLPGGEQWPFESSPNPGEGSVSAPGWSPVVAGGPTAHVLAGSVFTDEMTALRRLDEDELDLYYREATVPGPTYAQLAVGLGDTRTNGGRNVVWWEVGRDGRDAWLLRRHLRISVLGFHEGVQGLRLYSQKPSLVSSGYLYRVRVRGSQQVIDLVATRQQSGADLVGPDFYDRGEDGPDLFLPWSRRAGALLSDTDESQYYLDAEDEVLVDQDLDVLYRPEQHQLPKSLPDPPSKRDFDGLWEAAKYNELVGLTSPGSVPIGADDGLRKYAHSWDVAIRVDASHAGLAFEHGLWAAVSDDADLLAHLNRPPEQDADGGFLNWYRTSRPRRSLAKGDNIFAAHLPIEIDPKETRPLLGGEQKALVSAPDAVTPVGVKIRFLLGRYQVLNVDANNVSLSRWDPNGQFELEGLPSDDEVAATTVPSMLQQMYPDYTLYFDTDRPAELDEATAGVGLGMDAAQAVRQFADWILRENPQRRGRRARLAWTVTHWRGGVRHEQRRRERIDALSSVMNKMFDHETIPHVPIRPLPAEATDSGRTAGVFRPDWEFGLNVDHDRHRAWRVLGTTMVHEGRHGQQLHWQARVLAGRGRRLDELRRGWLEERSVLLDALRQPLRPGDPEYQFAAMLAAEALRQRRLESADNADLRDAAESFDLARAEARKTKTEAITELLGISRAKIFEARRRPRNGQLLIAWKELILAAARYEHQVMERDAFRVERRLAATMPEPKPLWWDWFQRLTPPTPEATYEVSWVPSGWRVHPPGRIVAVPPKDDLGLVAPHRRRLRITVEAAVTTDLEQAATIANQLTAQWPKTLRSEMILSVATDGAVTVTQALTLASTLRRFGLRGPLRLPRGLLTDLPLRTNARIKPVAADGSRAKLPELAVEFFFYPDVWSALPGRVLGRVPNAVTMYTGRHTYPLSSGFKAEQTEDGIVVRQATRGGTGARHRPRSVPYDPDAVRLTLDAGAVEVGEGVLAGVIRLLNVLPRTTKLDIDVRGDVVDEASAEDDEAPRGAGR